MPGRRRRLAERPSDPARALVEAFAAQLAILERQLEQVYEESYLATSEGAGRVRVTSMAVEFGQGGARHVVELGDGQDEAVARLPGLYRGVVADPHDPLGARRLLVKVPTVLGEDARWAVPALAAAEGEPSVGDRVWVMFEAGSPDAPVWLGPIP
jgi:hypothetical protein